MKKTLAMLIALCMVFSMVFTASAFADEPFVVNACIASEGMDNVFPVDSRNLSTGIGQLVIAAAEMAAEGGMSAREIAATGKTIRTISRTSTLKERSCHRSSSTAAAMRSAGRRLPRSALSPRPRFFRPFRCPRKESRTFISI